MATEPNSSMDPARAMYATLGLTGFGAGNGPTRKRRVDEAFTEFNCNSFNPDASGSNSVPLGVRRKSDDSGTPEASSSAQEVANPAGAAPDATSTPLAATSANQDPSSDAADPTAGMKASDARKYWKKLKKDQEAPPASGLSEVLAYAKSLPVPPVRPNDEASSSHGGYFLPSFVEDPWSTLLASRS